MDPYVSASRGWIGPLARPPTVALRRGGRACAILCLRRVEEIEPRCRRGESGAAARASLLLAHVRHCTTSRAMRRNQALGMIPEGRHTMQGVAGALLRCSSA